MLGKHQSMSVKTRQQQRQFFYILVLQTIAPLVLVCIPFTLLLVVFGAGMSVPQAFVNMEAFCLAVHGTIGSLLIIFFTQPYREPIIRMFWHPFRTKTPAIIQFYKIVSDVGGTLGKFFGASVVTILEVIYIFYQHYNQ
ncbi:unnamed protein product, partial [Mesorhabditis belari]|uniref:G protein-coupled receptor n=1 Tax=Mesorhabditis belari TaxID=2138241 RepID=A0AAF3EKB0_9BILA